MDRTKSEVELELDEFALEEVERIAGRLGVSRERIVENAIRHWREEESRGRLAAHPPALLSAPAPHRCVPIAVDMRPADWEAVKRAARAEDIEPETLVGHAVLLLLADLDAGRVAGRVARSSNGLGRS